MPASRTSLRIYRRLIGLYPAAFRARYEDELVTLFADQLRDARASGGGARSMAVWARMLVDLVATASSEHGRRDRTMGHALDQPSMMNRALGITGILGGFLLMAAIIPGIPWGWLVFNLRLAVFESGAIAIIVAVYRLTPDRWRSPSLLVAVPAILANAWHLVMSVTFVTRPQPPEADPEFRPWYALAATALWIGTALYGLMSLRLGVVSRWGSLALAGGATLAVTGVSGLGFTTGANAEFIANLTVAGIVLVGIGWMILGIEVAFRRPTGSRAPNSAAPAPKA